MAQININLTFSLIKQVNHLIFMKVIIEYFYYLAPFGSLRKLEVIKWKMYTLTTLKSILSMHINEYYNVKRCFSIGEYNFLPVYIISCMNYLFNNCIPNGGHFSFLS